VDRARVDPRRRTFAVGIYTHIGMALSKLLGFDLCPRLKNLRQRRLHVPHELAVPPCLQGVVERDVSLKQIRAGWDGLVRVARSIEGGWTSAVLALERLGSAARADATYKAGTALGKLLLSLFL
jgi:TnpA family transposase